MAIKRLLLLSGAIGSGKSTVASELRAKHSFVGLSSGSFLREQLKIISSSDTRLNLQELGDRLDKETAFSWLIDSVAAPTMKAAPDVENWLLDAVRKSQQVELFRARFGSIVKHIHLTAPEVELQRRYIERAFNQSLSNYFSDIEHPNEISSRSLGLIADYTFDTSKYSSVDIASKIISTWG